MKYHASIEIHHDPVRLLKCMGPEAKNTKTDRTTLTFTKKPKHLLVSIDAKDSVALRAAMNNITKLCTVYEQLE